MATESLKSLRRRLSDSSPIISQSSVLLIGVFVALLSWPPVILLISYGLSVFIPHCFDVKDRPEERRRRFQIFMNNEAVPASLRIVPGHIKLEERYWSNSRGMALMSTILSPKAENPKGLVIFVHGYSDSFSFVKRREYRRLVTAGYIVAGVEIEGHGRSDGSAFLVYDWNLAVKDIVDHIQDVRSKFEDQTKVFLVGESMGGALAFYICEQLESIISGVIFVAPMCKISDDLLPPKWVVELLERIIGDQGTNTMLGYLPIAPSKGSVVDKSFQVIEKRDLVLSSPLKFDRNPRLSTARELILATRYISSNLSSLKVPFLVQHGKADMVTDPKLSQALYDEAQSKDKTIKLYDNMWHALTSGECDQHMDQVFGDMVEWLNKRL